MPMIEDGSGRLVSPPVHGFFGLSYAAYFVVPRLALQEMPLDWQERFVALMEEAEDVIGRSPDYHVLRADPAYTSAKPEDDEDPSSRLAKFYSHRPDPWANYRRGRLSEVMEREE